MGEKWGKKPRVPDPFLFLKMLPTQMRPFPVTEKGEGAHPTNSYTQQHPTPPGV